MRTFFTVFFAVVLVIGCAPKKTEKVETHTTVGLFTPYRFFPETLNWQLKEVKEVNYWAVEKDGTVEVGAKITPEEYDSIRWTHNFTAEFKPNGELVQTVFPDEKDGLMNTWGVFYDGETAVGAEFMEGDTMTYSVKIIPKEGGNLNFETYRQPADTLLNTLEAIYDANKNYQSLQWYNFKSEPTFSYQYSYDEARNMTGFTGTRDDTVRNAMNFTYNEQGSAITQELINYTTGEKTFNKYEYSYDENGNWIKCVAYQDDKPYIVAMRDYVYYE